MLFRSALRQNDRVRVILANMGDEPTAIALEMPGVSSATVRRLDDQTALLAASEPEVFRGARQSIGGEDGIVSIELPPFELATVDTSGLPS